MKSQHFFSTLGKSLVCAFVMLLVSGCGFHLKTGLSQFDSAVRMDASAKQKLPADLYHLLSRSLNSDLAGDESAELLVHSYDNQKRRISQARRSVSDEFVFIRSIEYSLALGNQLIGPLNAEVQAVFQSDTRQALANNSEQALLQQELEQKLVNKLSRQINTLLNNRIVR